MLNFIISQIFFFFLTNAKIRDYFKIHKKKFQLRDSFRSAFGRNGAGGSKKPGFQPRNGENSLCIIDDSSEINSHDQTHLDSVESLRSALQEKDNR